jgi:DNA mismatch repair ATPase MutS
MKVFLMHRDQDIDLERKPPPNHKALTQDLELDTLMGAMAAGDPFLFDVGRSIILTSLTDPDAIVYRQRVLGDCLEQPSIVRQMYDIAVEALQSERKVWGFIFRDSPDRILSRSVQVLELLVGSLKQLRQLADDHASKFHSEGFVRFFAMLADELDDEYFATIDEHLKELRLRRGVLMSAELGKGNKGVHYILHRLPEQSWLERTMERITDGSSPGYSFQIPDRDENGFRALTQLREQGINLVANALAQSTDHVLSFFTVLRAELAFYAGCLNLHEGLVEKGEPTCFPDLMPAGRSMLSAHGLYDVCLTLNLEARVVGNDVSAEDKALVMITGANQGGKSTFLRSVGLAQLMMQSGMFVAAESFRANVCDGVFTHYKREEDASMESGKLDEELSRMSDIADRITPNCILLCNESFAATNEREGSEIARQVVRALIEEGVKVFFVTHLFDLAHGFYRQRLDTALVLRAERQPDGGRTFQLIEGEPLPTSYGEDSYRRIFGAAPEAAVRLRTSDGELGVDVAREEQGRAGVP